MRLRAIAIILAGAVVLSLSGCGMTSQADIDRCQKEVFSVLNGPAPRSWPQVCNKLTGEERDDVIESVVGTLLGAEVEPETE